jgi:hypothetical protein
MNVGDVAFVDSSHPITWLPRGPNQWWLSLHLEREALASHLGFEPSGGDRGVGRRCGRRYSTAVLTPDDRGARSRSMRSLEYSGSTSVDHAQPGSSHGREMGLAWYQ